MKRTLLSLAILLGLLPLAQSVLAQNGTTNGSGSGFLNTDLMIGRGGTVGPAALNLKLNGAQFLSGYGFPPFGGPGRFGYGAMPSVSGRILTQPAVLGGSSCGWSGGACGTCGTMSQSAIIEPSCGLSTGSALIPPLATPGFGYGGISPSAGNLIVPGLSAPIWVDY